MECYSCEICDENDVCLSKLINSGGCSAPVGVSTKLKPFDSQYKLKISGAVWSLDGTIKISHALEETFPQITKTQKHKLSPTEENDCKKIKVQQVNTSGNPIEELNSRISEKTGNISCEDTSSGGEDINRKCKIFCGLTEHLNMPLDVILKCENLGFNLAQTLIDKGALEVMKVTQDLIRSSAANKS